MTLVEFWDACGLGEQQCMSKAQYAQVHRLIACALAPDMSATAEKEALQEDWADDLRGGRDMTFEKYMLSLFEIAGCPRARPTQSLHAPLPTAAPRSPAGCRLVDRHRG